MQSRLPIISTILDAKAATGVGRTITTTAHRNIILSIATAGNANLTVKVQGALGEIEADGTYPVDFTAAQSVSNMWDYLQIIDLEDGSIIDGDTGFVVTGTDDFRHFEINTNGIDFITLNVTARSAGSVTAKARLVTNA